MKIRGVHLAEFVFVFERMLTLPEVTHMGKTFQRRSDRVFAAGGPMHTRFLACEEWSLTLDMIEVGNVANDFANARRVIFSGSEDVFMRDMIALKIELS